ncbi:serine hydroxymethyltransferase [Candidatus Dependentiae bacterium]|nr:MAG: serine hydroxymethyltransferase [Candidatus Dependentiae bacterium]
MAQDKALFDLINAETDRQETTINLIASENYASKEVREATGSVLTNKYAEGYPGKRYYAGCAVVDEVEQIAIDRCKTLFQADHVNVQPHSGSQANMAAYFAVLKPGDTILGMSLAEGGHLTHGHPVNFSGQLYKVVQYHVNPQTELIDYDEIERLAQTHKPKLIIAGASAYSRSIDFEQFARIAKNAGALLLADIAHIAGLIAAGLHQNPFPHADIVTSTTHKTLRGPRGGLIMCKQELAEKIDKSVMPGIQGGPFMNVIAAKAVAFYEASLPTFKTYQQQVIANAQRLAQELSNLGYRIVAKGTDNHLFIVDLRSKKITGRQAEQALDTAGITASRSCIPHDPEKPWITSGIRLGTTAISSRGMREQEMTIIAKLIDEVLSNPDDKNKLKAVRSEIKELCTQFPIP